MASSLPGGRRRSNGAARGDRRGGRLDTHRRLWGVQLAEICYRAGGIVLGLGRGSRSVKCVTGRSKDKPRQDRFWGRAASVNGRRRASRMQPPCRRGGEAGQGGG